MTFSALIANTDTGLIPYTTKQLQECNILNMKPRKAPTLDKLITVLLQIAIKRKQDQSIQKQKQHNQSCRFSNQKPDTQERRPQEHA
jgi:hypothetical protein